MTTPSRAFAPLDFAQLLATALIWGVNIVASMIAIDTFPPLMVAAMRFLIVLVVLAPLLKPLPLSALKPLLAMTLLVGPLHFGVQNIGLSLAHDLAPMAVAMQLWVPFSVLFAALLLKEPISPLRLIGVLCAFLGVAWMGFDPVVFAQLGALALIALAAACYAFGAVLVRRTIRVGAWTMQAWIALVTTPVAAFGSLAFETGQVEALRTAGWLPWACVLFAAIVSSLFANAFMFNLVQKYEVSRTTPYLLLSPLIAFVLGALVLDDQVTPQIAIGAAATLAGVLLVAIAERRFRAVR